MWARSILVAIVSLLTMAVQASLVPTRLRCEYLVNPIGLDEPVPRLSWIVGSKDRGARQVAYQILVATSPGLLKPGQADLWDSGRVAGGNTVNIEYGGTALGERQVAYWTVASWDAVGNRSSWAKPAYWEAGIRTWKAQWIGMPDDPKLAVDSTGAKWIWTADANPEAEAPSGDRFFKRSVNIDGQPGRVRLGVAADDSFTISVNGKQVGAGRGWATFTDIDATADFNEGENLIEIKATNGRGRAGLLVAGTIERKDGRLQRIVSDAEWSSSIDGTAWQNATALAEIDSAPFGQTTWMYGAHPATYLRRQFSVSSKPSRARAYVSAKGLYELFIDDKRVERDVFRPGWTDYRKRIQYQTYDVTSFLTPGNHEILMVVGDGWYAGHVGLAGRENYGAKPMGLCQIELDMANGSNVQLGTDGSWQAGTGPIRANDLLMGEDYDARLAPNGWKAVEVEPLDTAVEIVAQRSPSVRELYEFTAKSVKEPKPGVYVYDLGQNMVGWARLKVRGKAGDKVTLRFAEMLNPDGTIYTTNLRGARATDTYTLKGEGEEVWEPSFTFHGFRYVEVIGYPGKPGKSAITGVVAGSDIPQTGTFECSNAMVNQLWHNIYWGQRGNYLEVPTDCPQRDERLGWMGDAQIFARTATYNNDIAAFMTKWLDDVVDAQSKEGGFSDVSPRIGDLSDGAPAWGDAGVIVPWTMYLAYGDRRLLERHYASMKAWVDYIDVVNPDHTWAHRRNNDFGDWLNVHAEMPRDVLGTAYFAHSTDIVAKAARVLGKIDDAEKYETLRDNIRKAFTERFVSPDGTIKGNTQTCYVMALWFELIPESMRANAIKRLVDDVTVARENHLSTGFVGVGYLNPTLSSIGALDVAYRLLLTDTYPSWGYSIKHGATTIWERWDGWTEDKGFQDPGMNSFNHYALGSVGEWLYSTVAGIDLDPARPGFEHIVIRPMPGPGLTRAKASYESVRGRIETSWSVSKGEFRLRLTIPANTTATVILPTSEVNTATMDGQPCGSKVEIGAGTYDFTCPMR